jgi:hypothetical protein
MKLAYNNSASITDTTHMLQLNPIQIIVSYTLLIYISFHIRCLLTMQEKLLRFVNIMAFNFYVFSLIILLILMCTFVLGE